ncbi:MAG: ABC transporter permease [Synergistaceae bacterium]|nr:ABC transporter permease [Synergistaceae bacterium]
MGRYILRRILVSIPVVIGVSFLAFLVLHLTPGDPAVLLAGPDATPEIVMQVREKFGLNRPLYTQYFFFLKGLLNGSLTSMKYEVPVLSLIGKRLKNTAQLAGCAFCIAIALGMGAGILSALYRYTFIDYIATFFALIGISMPAFWLAILFILCFSVILGWLPSNGMGSWRHLIMPSFVLGMGSAGIIARMTRSSMMAVLGQDYVTTAHSKGLPERIVICRHALRNAMIPTVTVVGLQIGSLMTGAVLTESVFAWPGLGRLLVEAILGRDYPVVQATLLIIALIFVIANLFVDLLYALLDPRIRYD